MIQSFADKGTEDVYHGANTKLARHTLPSSLTGIAGRKFDMLDAAVRLHDLRQPPANRLEALRGILKGKYSIRINDQWRIVFCWGLLGPQDVQIVDYH